MSVRIGCAGSPFRRLPSDEWRLVPLHWHAYSRLVPPDSPPDQALFDPFAVATWLAERSAAHLWQQHLLIASRGDSVRHNEMLVQAVLNEQCLHGCVTRSVPTRRS